MNAPFTQHRSWLVTIAGALALMLLAGPLTAPLQNWIEDKEKAAQIKRQTLFDQIRQLESDALAAEELAQSMEGKDVQSFLLPASRTAMAGRIEALAAQARLSALTYQIAPAQPWQGKGADTAIEGLSQTQITLEAEAPTDGDVLRFLDSLNDGPGRMEVLSLTMERIQRALGPANIRLRVTLSWLANAEKGKG